MAQHDELERTRSQLQMINPAPYNAEAPPEALTGATTPTDLHYVRSNFAVPAHDGTLEIGGAVERPITLTLDDLRAMPAVERAVTLECAGNGRLEMRPLPIGEPWGDYAVSTASWKGARSTTCSRRREPTADGVEVRFEGADSGPYHLHPILAETNKDDLTFVRSLPLALAADPAAEILVAYEMNGEPLRPDHGAPFRIIVPHWFAVASVKWLHRIDVLTEPYVGEFQTGHYIYEWPDRPHEPVTLMRVRARITDPAPGAELPTRHAHRPRQGLVGHRPDHRASRSASPAKASGTRPTLEPPNGPYQWQDWTFDWTPAPRRPSHPSRSSHRRRRQRPARGPAVEPARLRQQRRRSDLRRRR